MSDNNIKVGIVADASGVTEGMARAQQAVADAVANIEASFKSLGDMLAASSAAKMSLSAGETSAVKQSAAERLEIEKTYSLQRLELMRAGIENQIALTKNDPNSNPVALDALNKQLLAVTEAYEEKKRKIVQKAQIEQDKSFTLGQRKLETSWTNSLAKMLEGHATFGATLNSMWNGLVTSIISQIARITAQWAVAQLLQKETNFKSIVDNAKVAATGAYKWGANIGGPILGAVSAAAAFAGTMAYASAEGGYDIPAGVNPLTQLHAREMVLPAQHADVIRGLAEGGGAGGSANITINAVDSVSVRRLFENHGTALVAALKSQNRNFAVL